MLSKVHTAALFGIDAYLVTVETDLTRGLPAFYMVGLPSATIRESKERVRSAIINSGRNFPAKRITVNLAPAANRKEGSHFDLPIAVGILISNGEICSSAVLETGFLGELSLDGRLVKVEGALPLVTGFQKTGIKKLILPSANAAETAIAKGVEIIPAESLFDVIKHLRGEKRIPIYNKERKKRISVFSEMDFAEVRGQETAKRAILIAVSGGHSIYFTGPPGTGKTMLARRIPTIMPTLSQEEMLELTKIYSIAGLLTEKEPFVHARPFRTPHPTVTEAALAGGGRIPKPGEMSLAHRGVLFLDEFPEFGRRQIELLRQPLETGEISVERTESRAVFPADFLLVAAGNPCKCGFFGDSMRLCTCSGNEIRLYQSKLSGPIADRIDLQVRVEREEDTEDFGDGGLIYSSKTEKATGSREMREAVAAALDMQKRRYQKETEGILTNAKLSGKSLILYCPLDRSCRRLMQEARRAFALSERGCDRVLKVARTIADLAQSEQIREEHIAEALQYRMFDLSRRKGSEMG